MYLCKRNQNKKQTRTESESNCKGTNKKLNGKTIMELNSEKIKELKSHLLKGDVEMICRQVGCGRNTYYTALERTDINKLTRLQRTVLEAFIKLATKRQKEKVRFASQVANRISSISE